jgi:hypothetical protein
MGTKECTVPCYTTYLETTIDKLFDVYSPVPTYTIVDNLKDYYGFVPAAEYLPGGHITAFSTDDAEYKFRAFCDAIQRLMRSADTDQNTSYWLFMEWSRILMTDAWNKYNDEVADAIDVVFALTCGVEQYSNVHGSAPLDMRTFIHEYMENGLEFALE